jgi:hypothetical protein
MENSRFIVLTGHLNDYPLPDLVGILRHQQKTGRLRIEYPNGPASFFFQEGELVDVQLNALTGLQAICVAAAQPPSSFNFNPLITPSRRSIENSLQRVVSELLGCWDESAAQIEAVADQKALSTLEFGATPASTSNDTAELKEVTVLALPGLSQPRQLTNRTMLMIAAAGLTMAGLSTVIAVTGRFRSTAEVASPSSAPSDSRPAIQNAVASAGSVSPNQSRRNLRIQTGALKERQAIPDAEQSRARQNDTTQTETGESALSDQSRKNFAARNDSGNASGDGIDKGKPAGQSVSVVMQIENGRVLKASIPSHKPGMDNYEALALRIARQRRYPSKANGQETVRITVTQPE